MTRKPLPHKIQQQNPINEGLVTLEGIGDSTNWPMNRSNDCIRRESTAVLEIVDPASGKCLALVHRWDNGEITAVSICSDIAIKLDHSCSGVRSSVLGFEITTDFASG